MREVLKFFFALVLFIGCSSSDQVPDLSEHINYSYRAIVYWGDPEDNKIHQYKYFNDKGKLIEVVGREYRSKFIYDEQGQLVETVNCRVYDCSINWRRINIHDTNGNLIGHYTTKDTLVDLDTVIFKQIKFYDDNSHLIKELTDRGSDVNGERYEYWKQYTYKNDLIVKEIETRNGDTTWIGKYTYDKRDNVITIHREDGELYEIETFIYDQSSRLIKKTIESNMYPLTKDVSFSVGNNSTKFMYDDLGRLLEEVTYNHKWDEKRKFVYVYENKK